MRPTPAHSPKSFDPLEVRDSTNDPSRRWPIRPRPRRLTLRPPCSQTRFSLPATTRSCTVTFVFSVPFRLHPVDRRRNQANLAVVFRPTSRDPCEYTVFLDAVPALFRPDPPWYSRAFLWCTFRVAGVGGGLAMFRTTPRSAYSGVGTRCLRCLSSLVCCERRWGRLGRDQWACGD